MSHLDFGALLSTFYNCRHCKFCHTHDRFKHDKFSREFTKLYTIFDHFTLFSAPFRRYYFYTLYLPLLQFCVQCKCVFDHSKDQNDIFFARIDEVVLNWLFDLVYGAFRANFIIFTLRSTANCNILCIPHIQFRNYFIDERRAVMVLAEGVNISIDLTHNLCPHHWRWIDDPVITCIFLIAFHRLL